jgi:hypothetical protein
MTRWLISLTLAAGAFTALTGEIGIREDELRCEEAKKHLIDCCGDSYRSLDCTYDEGGCDSAPRYPELSVSEAVGIRDQSCDELRNDYCGGAP